MFVIWNAVSIDVRFCTANKINSDLKIINFIVSSYDSENLTERPSTKHIFDNSKLRGKKKKIDNSFGNSNPKSQKQRINANFSNESVKCAISVRPQMVRSE